MKKLTIIAYSIILSLIFASCNNSDTENLPHEEALKVLDAKLKKDGDNADLLYQRGVLLVEIGKEKKLAQYFKEAINDLQKATDIDDSHAEYFTALADAQFSLGNVNDSYASLQKALKIDPDNFEACLKLGEIAFYSRNYTLAMENLDKVTKQDKDNRTALFMKGFICQENGDTTNAVLYYRRLIEVYPDYETGYEMLGMLYSQYRNKLGVEYLSTALSLDPKNLNVLYGLAQCYQDVEDAEKATEYYVKMLEIDPQNKYAWFNRGRMELELYEDYNAAADFFGKAIESDPYFAEAYFNRGLAYEALGNNAEAAKNFQEARELGYEAN